MFWSNITILFNKWIIETGQFSECCYSIDTYSLQLIVYRIP